MREKVLEVVTGIRVIARNQLEGQQIRVSLLRGTAPRDEFKTTELIGCLVKVARRT
jgi:hypothetical protein